jgi:hypothetical protein
MFNAYALTSTSRQLVTRSSFPPPFSQPLPLHSLRCEKNVPFSTLALHNERVTPSPGYTVTIKTVPAQRHSSLNPHAETSLSAGAHVAASLKMFATGALMPDGATGPFGLLSSQGSQRGVEEQGVVRNKHLEI